jgi:hypothetical protein
MELKEIEQIWASVKRNEREEFIKKSVHNFNLLCEKAKCLIWEEAKKPNSCFLDVWDIDDALISLSPIEQIMSVALSIFEYKFCEVFPISFYYENQEKILYNNKTYWADITIRYMIMNGTEYECEKPIIIECDGYDAHHTKEQRNHDIERENNLKAKGYSIIRFTGTQIFKNPYDCVMRAYKFLLDENRSVIKKARDDMHKEQELLQKLEERKNAQANG